MKEELVDCKQQGEGGEGGGEGEAIAGAGNRLLPQLSSSPALSHAATARLGPPSPLLLPNTGGRALHSCQLIHTLVCHSFLVCCLLDLFVCCLLFVCLLFVCCMFVCCLFVIYLLFVVCILLLLFVCFCFCCCCCCNDSFSQLSLSSCFKLHQNRLLPFSCCSAKSS